jgi:DNA-binding NarL/FixJ family response regulator
VLIVGSSVPFDRTLDALRRLATEAPQVRVLIVREDPEDARSLEALLAGAGGVVGAQDPAERLREACARLVRGEAVASPQLQRHLVERFRRATHSWRGMRPLVSPLSTREWQVLDALRDGASTQQVADQLGVSRATVYSHLRNISRKLRTRSREEALAVADELRRRAGMGDGDERSA